MYISTDKLNKASLEDNSNDLSLSPASASFTHAAKAPSYLEGYPEKLSPCYMDAGTQADQNIFVRAICQTL